MTYRIFVPSALALYAYGFECMFRTQWVENSFKLYVEDHIIRKKSPSDLLYTTLPNGLLYHLGSWLFDEYFVSEVNLLFQDPQTQWAYIERVLYLLDQSGCCSREAWIDLFMLIDDINDIWDPESPSRFNRLYRRKKYDERALEIHSDLLQEYNEDFSELNHIYAINFAERLFHDRQYCEFVNYIIAHFYDFNGLPTINNQGGFEVLIVERKKWPKWVIDTLRARERGKCASCSKSFDELESEAQIDHIIPLAEGGFNDLVNLQLLCESCNKTKGKAIRRVNSSIPQYINWDKAKRAAEINKRKSL